MSNAINTQEPTHQVESLVCSTYENQLGVFLGKAMSRGWKLLTPPVYVGSATPEGFNSAVVSPHPHFLIVVCKVTVPYV